MSSSCFACLCLFGSFFFFLKAFGCRQPHIIPANQIHPTQEAHYRTQLIPNPFVCVCLLLVLLLMPFVCWRPFCIPFAHIISNHNLRQATLINNSTRRYGRANQHNQITTWNRNTPPPPLPTWTSTSVCARLVLALLERPCLCATRKRRSSLS